jgi:hypothetical protein
MRVDPDHTDRTRDAIEIEVAFGVPIIDLAARLAPPDSPSIRTRLATRRPGGLRDRLARQPLGSPAR